MAASCFVLSMKLIVSPAYSEPMAVGPILGYSKQYLSKNLHGTCSSEIQNDLRFGVDATTADYVACFNTNIAEKPGYAFQPKIELEKAFETAPNNEVTFYDSVTTKELFKAPSGRGHESFLAESRELGYLSFTDAEVNWSNVRLLTDGTVVSTDGTYLGRAAPSLSGNHYAINLSTISGSPKETWL